MRRLGMIICHRLNIELDRQQETLPQETISLCHEEEVRKTAQNSHNNNWILPVESLVIEKLFH